MMEPRGSFIKGYWAGYLCAAGAALCILGDRINNIWVILLGVAVILLELMLSWRWKPW